MQNQNIPLIKKVFPTAKHFKFDEYVQHSKTTFTLENLLMFVEKKKKKDVVIQQI